MCLTIAGFDPTGGAGVIADIQTFSAFGCFATAAITSVTFQNSSGVFGGINQTAAALRGQVEPIFDEYPIAAVKTGMLPTRDVIEETARLIKSKSLANVIVDPVIRATSGHKLIDDDAVVALIEILFPLAELITPNIPEAERLSGISIRTSADVANAASVLRQMGARNVLIKGGHPFGGNNSKTATDYLFLGDSQTVLKGEFIESSIRGTGCRLSSAIAANLALGNEMIESVRSAKEYVTKAIRTANLEEKVQ